MRKALVLALAVGLLLPLTSRAQYREGSVSTGGSLSFNSYRNGGEDGAFLSGQASVAWSYDDADMLGIMAGLTNYYTSFGFDQQEYTLSPFWRRNFPLSASVGAYARASLELAYSTDEYYGLRTWGAGPGAGFGLYYFVTPRFTVEAALGSARYLRLAEFEEGEPVFWANKWNVFLTNGIGFSLYYLF